MIQAMLTGEPFEAPVNIPNTGQAVGLPADAVIESICVIDGDGIRGRDRTALPTPYDEIVRRHVATQELTVEAALRGDRTLAGEAFALDPLAGRGDLRATDAMVDELLAGTAEWLPQFAHPLTGPSGGTRMRIGFIGLGAMGLPMAGHLVAAGHDVTVASRSRGPIDAAVALGAADGGSPLGVAEASDVDHPLRPQLARGGRGGRRHAAGARARARPSSTAPPSTPRWSGPSTPGWRRPARATSTRRSRAARPARRRAR